MPALFTDETRIINRIGRVLCDRLLGEGRATADTDVLTQIATDATSKLGSYLAGIYDLAGLKALESIDDLPHEVVRLCTDIAEAMIARRYPEGSKRSWKELMDEVNADLKMLRQNTVRLDTEGSPEPAANAGGTFVGGDPDTYDESTYVRTFDDMGDF